MKVLTYDIYEKYLDVENDQNTNHKGCDIALALVDIDDPNFKVKDKKPNPFTVQKDENKPFKFSWDVKKESQISTLETQP